MIGQAVSEKKIFENGGRRTDGRTTNGRRTDGRTTEHGYTISSPCEPDGSGELKNRSTSAYEEYELRIEEYQLRMLTYVRRTRDVPFVS